MSAFWPPESALPATVMVRIAAAPPPMRSFFFPGPRPASAARSPFWGRSFRVPPAELAGAGEVLRWAEAAALPRLPSLPPLSFAHRAKRDAATPPAEARLWPALCIVLPTLLATASTRLRNIVYIVVVVIVSAHAT